MKKEYITCDKCCYDILDSEGEVMEHECLSPELEVTSVRYFETRRGQGYECKTNRKGITIWNDGQGGQTYMDILSHLSSTAEERKKYRKLRDDDLEELIDDYEYKKFGWVKVSDCCEDEYEKIENEYAELKKVCIACGKYCAIKINKNENKSK